MIGDIVQDWSGLFRRGNNNVLDPVRTDTCGSMGGRCIGTAHVLNGIRSTPYPAGQRSVIAPAHTFSVESIGKRGVIRARVHLACFLAGGVDDTDGLLRRSGTTRYGERFSNARWIVRYKEFARFAHSGGSRNNKFMCREARALIRLEHPVPKGVLFRKLKIRRNFCWVDIVKGSVGRWTVGRSSITGNSDVVRAIHSATIVHGYEIGMCVAEIVIDTKR